MGRILKFPVLFLVMGMCYAQIELFARGVTYLPMTFIGGTAGALLGLLGRHPAFPRLKMWQLCSVGTLLVLDIEFISGLLCNRVLHMCLWDYSGYRYNIDGQVCLKLAFAWFLLIPLAFWMDGFLRWKLFGESRPDSLLHHYFRLITLR